MLDIHVVGVGTSRTRIGRNTVKMASVTTENWVEDLATAVDDVWNSSNLTNHTNNTIENVGYRRENGKGTIFFLCCSIGVGGKEDNIEQSY